MKPTHEAAEKAKILAQTPITLLANMRNLCEDDEVYHALISHIEGWCFGTRSWLEGCRTTQPTPQTDKIPLRVIQ